MPDSKICQTCGEAFSKSASISHAQWAGRRFCSRACASATCDDRNARIAAMYAAGLPSTQIAAVVGVSAQHALRVLRANGARVRTFYEAQAIRRTAEARG